MRTFVLIPGAGGSAWVWTRVARRLNEAGYEAIAVELPGDDEDAGLPDYARLMSDAIGACDDVTLVAGSLGGFTAPLVCERVPAIEAQEVAALAGGYGPFDPSTYFLHDLDADTVAEGEPHQRTEAAAAFASVCDFTTWPACEIRVLAGTDDRFFPAALQRRVARDRLGLDVDLMPGGHLLPLVHPQLVADYLLRA